MRPRASVHVDMGPSVMDHACEHPVCMHAVEWLPHQEEGFTQRARTTHTHTHTHTRTQTSMRLTRAMVMMIGSGVRVSPAPRKAPSHTCESRMVN
jgi:predicted phage tail protein